MSGLTVTRTRWAALLCAALSIASTSSWAAGPSPTVIAFDAQQRSVPFSGGNIVISGQVVDATACTLAVKPALKGLASSVTCSSFAVSAALPPNLKATALTYAFSLTAKGSGGTRSVTVSVVVGGYPSPTISNFAASGASLPFSGGTVQLTGRVDNATSCSIAAKPTIKGLASAVTCSGFTVPATLPGNVKATSLPYAVTLTAKGSGGTKTSVLNLSVDPYPAPQVAKFATDPVVLGLAGGAVSVSTDVLFAKKCSVSIAPSVKGFPAAVACSGLKKLALPATATATLYTLTLTSTGTSGTTSKAIRLMQGVPPSGLLAAGWGHTCAIQNLNKLFCWGTNGHGQLGNGSSEDSAAPVAVTGLGDVLAVAAGGEHSCAVLGSGAVRCWGRNQYGQLGDGTTSDSRTPVTVVGVDHAVAIAAGVEHSCAVLDSGAVRCWGRNQYGQLGNGTNIDTPLAVDVVGISDATAVAAGFQHSCAAGPSGVRCWGRNDSVQLGGGEYDYSVSNYRDSNTPVGLQWSLPDVVSLAAGSRHSCAVLASGDVKCWGDNSFVADAQASDPGWYYTFATVKSADHSTAVATGESFSCALRVDGKVLCWGKNFAGQLGVDGVLDSDSPVLVPGVSNALAIAATRMHVCVLLADGGVRCWGLNSQGQLGGGKRAYEGTTKFGLLGFQATKLSDSCAISTTGATYCWGWNRSGALGNGSGPDFESDSPLAVADMPSAMAVSSGYYFSCALTATGTVKCWGGNEYGQLGNGTRVNASTPVTVTGISDATAIAVSSRQSCAIVANGRVACWGSGLADNGLGSLVRATPELVAGVSQAVSIAVSDQNVCAVISDGTIRCWGENYHGQLGDGTHNSSSKPVTVRGISNARSVALGRGYACAVSHDGGVWCWGDQQDGASGWSDGQSVVRIEGIVDAVAVATYGRQGQQTCALRRDGTVSCWGRALVAFDVGAGCRYQECWGKDVYSVTPGAPVAINGLNDATALASGENACALRKDGSVTCWGGSYLTATSGVSMFSPQEVIGWRWV